MISGDFYGILHRLLLNEPIVPSPEGLFRTLGFVHVFSASGLHLIALESFLQKFFGRSLIAKKILTLFFWVFLILLWKLQGFRLGFARVLILFFLRALAKTRGFKWRIYYPLFLAFCFDFALGIDSGWQHYYLAILGGMLGLELSRKKNAFLQHFYLALGSWLMTAPLDLWQHHEVAWATPLWSMITIPIIALFLYPLSVFSFLLLDRIPSWLMGIWNQGADFLLHGVDTGITFSAVDDRVILISMFLAIFATIFYRKRSVVVGLLCLLMALKFHPRFQDPGMKLVQFDVGQGDSLLFKKGERVEMMDLGTSREMKPEAVLHRLAHYGVNRVDTVLFSHLDEDHAGGMRLLLPWVPIRSLEVNSRLERTKKVRKWLQDFPLTQWCERDCIQLASVDWVGTGTSGNELMATAIIPLSSQSVYLALGDSDSKQEAIFWDRNHRWVESFPHRLLKVSHHGSKYSSSSEFLNLVDPEYAILSVGRHNRYHHPHFSVMNRLLLDRIPIHRTDRDGDFIWFEKHAKPHALR